MGEWKRLVEKAEPVRVPAKTNDSAVTVPEHQFSIGARLANSQHRGNGWMDKVVDMREQLYAATGPTQFKRIKKDFSINEPDACERMLANPDIMYSIPQEFSPNVTNTAIPGGDKLVSNTKVKPVKQTHRQPDIGSSRLWDNNTKATHDSRK